MVDLEWPLSGGFGGAGAGAGGGLARRGHRDVRLYQTNDGGETDWVNGEPVTADGLETAAFLSCFGGNVEDSGNTDGDRKQWWANFEEPNEKRHHRSRLQHLLRGMPCIPANIARAEDAALDDLEWMVAELGAQVSAVGSIPRVDWLHLAVTIAIGETTYGPFDFESPWGIRQ